MPRSPFSLKSAHLLMWSSPLLLLILVFTLTSPPAPRAPEVSSPPPSSTSPVSTQVPNTTTTSLATTTPSAKVKVAAKTTVTTWLVVTNFSNVTTTSVKRVAPISNANALSGELSGALGPGFESVDVPLLGPGTWTLAASASTDQSLSCGGDASPVASQIVVGSNQSCQLEIASTSAETSLTWQLTPVS
jgi:hypothetical protein